MYLCRSYSATWDPIGFSSGLAVVLGAGAALDWITKHVGASESIPSGNTDRDSSNSNPIVYRNIEVGSQPLQGEINKP